jgi:hypothetical protein
MKGPQNLLEIEMLIRSVYLADGAKVGASTEHLAAADRLVTAGCARWAMTGHIAATEAGRFYVAHLLTVPYPVTKQVYTIPEVQS